MCYLYFYCLHCCLINIHIFGYPDSRLSGLFTEVLTSPDNQGSTVIGSHRLMGTYCTNINRIQQMNHTGQESLLAVVRPVGYYKWSQGVQPGTTWFKSSQWLEQDLKSGSPDLQSSFPTAQSHCLMIMKLSHYVVL